MQVSSIISLLYSIDNIQMTNIFLGIPVYCYSIIYQRVS